MVFTIMQYLNILNLSLNFFFLQTINSNAVSLTSLQRVENFLLLKELTTKILSYQSNKKDTIVFIEKVKVSWTENNSVLCLKDINLSIKPRKMYAVIGPVGAGKSSLCKLLIRELEPIEGQMVISGDISFASQEPWLFSGSIRSNILFGASYDEEKYQKVINACALLEDFIKLPNGDRTFVGENGMNLSGGQRARVNLARAVYRDVDIYLFDDPLSAVDTKVSKRIFDDCIKTLLKDKTCLLVTHQIQCMKDADEIILLQKGHLKFQGSFTRFQNDNQLFQSILSQNNKKTCMEEMTNPYASRISLNSNVDIVDIEAEYNETSKLMSEENETHLENPKEIEEMKANNNITYQLYWKYFKSGSSYCLLMITFTFYILTMVLCVGSNLWIAYWVKSVETYQQVLGSSLSKSFQNIDFIDSQKGLIILGTIIISIIVVSTLNQILFCMISLNTSKKIHDKMISCLLRSVMYFFDTNNSGRILNRFSKDLGIVDEIIPGFMSETYTLFFILIGVIIQLLITDWKLVFSVIAVIYVIHKVKILLLNTMQIVKRLESNAKSPVIAHVRSSLTGIFTIRSCNAQSMVRHQFDDHQDNHTSAFTMTDNCLMSYSLFVDLISLTFLSTVIIVFLVFKSDNTSGALVGLSMCQLIATIGATQKILRYFAEISLQIVAVERLHQYTKLEKEGPFESDQNEKPSYEWPDKGKIIFDQLSLKYSIGDGKPVLNNLNFSIEPETKLGIVGRTGAGKSSLVAALFRFAHLDGLLYIDDIDIKSIGLSDLRKKISVFPQEPILFSISLRENLDPYKKVKDDILWSVLEDVELNKVFDSLDHKLDFSSLSMGQRQLLCLSRIILHKNKIIIFDEATANLDNYTDSIIQKSIKSKFKDCTVLTIAHRLNTIMDSDKILVMDGGEVVEYDHPHRLLQEENSYFSKMVKLTGKSTSKLLKTIAEESYLNNQDVDISEINETKDGKNNQ